MPTCSGMGDRDLQEIVKLAMLVGPGGVLVCESVVQADLLSDHFDSKQSRESVDLRSLASVS